MGVCRICKCSWMTPAEWFLRLVSIYYYWGFSDVLIYLLDMGVLHVCVFWGVFDTHTFMTCMYTCPYFASAVFLGDTNRMMQNLSPHAHTMTSTMVTVFFCSCQSLMCITVTCHTSYQWTKQSSLLDNIFICACMKSNLFYFRQFVFIGHFMALYMYVSLTWPQLHWVFTMHFMTT